MSEPSDPEWKDDSIEYDNIITWVNEIGLVPLRLNFSCSLYINYTPKKSYDGNFKITTNEQIYTILFYDHKSFPVNYDINFLSSIAIKDGENLEVFYFSDFDDTPSLDFTWNPKDKFIYNACKDSITMDYPNQFSGGFMWTSGECIPSTVNVETEVDF
ncbi:hypothetical protein [Clostridiisalibacter paucivorans]|uniref:hypothetical protein n=1 Tax=Clostridiisalibacter paucivorans TaxID=408753 RepID=UPI00047A69F9|nr:hypothetical protein [Clostridiisalibacter paucivorans]